jgi:psiF repeat
MKKFIALAVMGLMFSVSAPVLAGAQQEKMKACNVEAKGMKGDERKTFMKACLSKDRAAATVAESKPTQTSKMKTCNEDAKGKTGDERKAFMSNCLKK